VKKSNLKIEPVQVQKRVIIIYYCELGCYKKYSKYRYKIMKDDHNLVNQGIYQILGNFWNPKKSEWITAK
jgi:hypothetical protein